MKGKYLRTKLIIWNKGIGLCLTSQCFKVSLLFLNRDEDFHKENSMELLKYIFQFKPESCLSEVVKLLMMNGVFAVSSASVERSFSCLKRVKTYLRTTMGQNRLSCLCRISIHKDFLKSMEDSNQLHENLWQDPCGAQSKS